MSPFHPTRFSAIPTDKLLEGHPRAAYDASHRLPTSVPPVHTRSAPQAPQHAAHENPHYGPREIPQHALPKGAQGVPALVVVPSGQPPKIPHHGARNVPQRPPVGAPTGPAPSYLQPELLPFNAPTDSATYNSKPRKLCTSCHLPTLPNQETVSPTDQ